MKKCKEQETRNSNGEDAEIISLDRRINTKEIKHKDEALHGICSKSIDKEEDFCMF